MSIFQHFSKAGAALCVLISSGAVRAQTVAESVTQDVTNQGAITQTAVSLTVSGTVDVAASISASATGAVGSVSVSGLNQAFPLSVTIGGAPVNVAGLGALRQTVLNSGAIHGGGTATLSAASGIALDTGAAIGISGTGAVSSYSVQGVAASSDIAFGALPVLAGIHQATTNIGTVDVTDGKIVLNVPSLSTGAGASLSIAAVGASSSVSHAAVAQSSSVTIPAIQTGDVTQTTSNTARVVNSGSEISRTPASTIPGSQGPGFSASLSATGAATSLGLLAAGNGITAGRVTGLGATFGVLTQSSSNSGAVANSIGAGSFPLDLRGTGASLSVSGIGATASISATALNVATSGPAPTMSAIDQTALNDGAVQNGLPVFVYAGQLLGKSTSLSLSAAGATASYGSTAIASQGYLAPAVTGGLRQAATNRAAVANLGAFNLQKELAGVASSIGSSAVGASLSIGATFVSSSGGQSGRFGGAVAQASRNEALVTNNIGNSDTGSAVGSIAASATAGSVALTATGAAASIGNTAVDGAGSLQALQFASGVEQSSSNLGDVALRGNLVVAPDTAGRATGSVSGVAGSMSIAATGAAGSIASSSLAPSGGFAMGTMSFSGAVTQTATNAGTVTDGDVAAARSPSLALSSLLGTGSSAGISATGASLSISATIIGDPASGITSGTYGGMSFAGNVTQAASNTGAVRNGLSATRMATLGVEGSLSGLGASASVATTGAVASVSTSIVGFTGTVTPISFVTAIAPPTLTQTATNGAEVATFGAIRVAGAIQGVAASASVSTTGAAASVSNSSIAAAIAAAPLARSSQAAVVQKAMNGFAADETTAVAAPINNTGSITAALLSGTGASASVAASGAAASISVSSVRDTTIGVPTPFASIAQTAVNSSRAPVTNSGSIALGGLGLGTSASISAAGATASVSYRAVK